MNPLQEEKAGGVSKRSKRAPARESVAVHPHKLIKIQLANAPPPEKWHIPVWQSMLNKGSTASVSAKTANTKESTVSINANTANTKGSAASVNAYTANTKGSATSVNEEDSWLVLYIVNRGAAKGTRGDLRKNPTINTITRSVTCNNPPMDVMARDDLDGAAVSVATFAAAPNTTVTLQNMEVGIIVQGTIMSPPKTKVVRARH